MSDQTKSLRVLIVRLGAMGDILHALPAVTALRAAHPHWFLGWAVEPHWRGLLAADSAGFEQGAATAGTASMPLVDQLHLVNAKRWAREPLAPATLRALLACRRELRASCYDVAVDLQGAVRSAVVARWAQPKRLLGEAAPREPLARWWFSEHVATSGVHVIEQAAEVCSAIADDALRFPLPLLPVDDEGARWCELHAPPLPYALLSPGAGWGAKRWPAARYAAVARALAAQGLQVAINAGPAEQALAADIAAQSGARVLAPTLSQLIELTRRASIAVAGDTGPLHLAAALGLPTVGIFGPTDPARNGPFHGNYTVLRHPESRRDHSRRHAPEAGLLTITPEEVVAAVAALLAARGAAREHAHVGSRP